MGSKPTSLLPAATPTPLDLFYFVKLIEGTWNSRSMTLGDFMALIIDAAPATLDTLNELAAALGDDPNYAATIAAQLAAIGADIAAIETALAMLQPLPLSFNFSADGECRFRADVAMTLTQQATSGSGTVAYEKSTAAAPGTFAATASPIALEAGAWLKVTASLVDTIFSVALKRTA